MRRIDFIGRLLVITLFTGVTQEIFSTPGFNIYKSWDFESEALGEYTDAEIREDFDVFHLYSHYCVSIAEDVINRNTTKVLKVTHTGGELNYGLDLQAGIGADYDELYLSYDFKFSEEFNSTSGGKLPGFCGWWSSFPANECPPDTAGFVIKGHFKRAGRLITYHYDRTKEYCPWGADAFNYDTIYFNNGCWYNITQRLVMNTFTGGVANSDGINEVWVDGRMIFKETGLKIMVTEGATRKIDGVHIAHWYGGSADEYIPLTTCYGYVDNIKVWIPVNDPTYGTHNTHDSNYILPTPDEITDRRVYYDSLRTTVGTLSNSEYGSTYSPCIDEAYLIDAGSGNTVSYTWNHAVGSGDYLFFYDGNTTDAKLLRMVSGYSNQSSQTVTSSGRYLFIRFSSDRGEESNGWTGTISFSNVPIIPTDFRITDIHSNRVELAWFDKSTIENGFQLQRADSTLEFAVIELLDKDITSYTDDFNLQQGKKYYYRLRAFNDFGYSDFTDTLRVYVSDISELPPPNLNSLRTTYNSVELSWDSLNVIDVSYTLYRIIPNIDTVVIENILTNHYTDEDLLSKTLYQYQIKARDFNGNCINSNICEGMTLPHFTQNRVSDSLIVLFIFAQRKNDTIFDQSWYKNPANLNIYDTSMLENVNSNYLRISRDNLFISNSSGKIREACQFSNEITLECWLKTSNAISTFPATLLSLENEQTVAFSLNCAKETSDSDRINYYINLTTNATDQKGKPDFAIEEPVETNTLKHIVFTHNSEGEETIYINKNPVATGFRPLKFDTWDDQYSLVIANNLTEDSPWLGDLYLCAIYNRALKPNEIVQNYYASPFSSGGWILNSDDYQISVYPNPVNDLLTISFTNINVNTEITQPYILSIYNQQGILVRKENVSEIIGNGILNLNISALNIGIYTFVLSNTSKFIDQKKVIIMR
jgi:hypothetical protein